MTFEEAERMMQFILEQQARLTVKHAEAEERMTRIEAAQENTARQIEQQRASTAEHIEHLAATTARQIEHLGAALFELTEAHARTEATVTRLAEAQIHGERRLDALIDIVRGLKGGAG